MVNIFKHFSTRKVFLSNVLFLSIIQYSSYLLPLLVYPYLIATVGASNFGLILFSQSFVAIFGLIISYGFDLSGVKYVSINRNNKKLINNVFFTITFIRFYLFLLCFVLLLILLYNVSIFGDDKVLHILTFMSLLELIVFPRWFFQGLEKMKYITITFASAKIISTILIFIFVSEPADYILVPLFYFISILLSILVILYIVFCDIKVKLYRPTLKDYKEQLSDGYRLFLASLSVGIYLNANVFLVGLFCSKELVAFYGVAEKIIKVIQSILKPVADTLFPHISFVNSRTSLKSSIMNIFKILKPYSLVLLSVSFLLYLFSDAIVIFLFGESNEEVIVIINIMILATLLGPLNFLIGNVGLMNLNETKYYSNSVVFVSSLSIILNLILIYYFSVRGAAIAFTVSELLLFILLYYKFHQIKMIATNL